MIPNDDFALVELFLSSELLSSILYPIHFGYNQNFSGMLGSSERNQGTPSRTGCER